MFLSICVVSKFPGTQEFGRLQTKLVRLRLYIVRHFNLLQSRRDNKVKYSPPPPYKEHIIWDAVTFCCLADGQEIFHNLLLID